MFHIFDNQNVISFATKNLQLTGELCQNSDGYVFLKISDDFIHKLFQFVNVPEKQIPDYFSDTKAVGAHISVVYPEELDSPHLINEIGDTFDFEIKSYFEATLGNKTYCGCTVLSPALLSLRAKAGLGVTLAFHGYQVPLHFTIAVVLGPSSSPNAQG